MSILARLLRPGTLILVVLIVVAVVVVVAFSGAGRDSVGTAGRAADIARGPYVSVNIEIDTQVSLGGDLARYTDFVSRYTGKLTTTSVAPLQASPDDCAVPLLQPDSTCTYSDQHIVDVERASRDSHSGLVGWLSIHVIVLNGYSSDDQPPLRVAGFTIDATAFVVFYPAIPSGFVPAVMSHETGHLMGLMCLNYPVSADSKCDGNGHSSDPESLMAPVLNTASPWVQKLELQPNEVDDLQNDVTNQPAGASGEGPVAFWA